MTQLRRSLSLVKGFLVLLVLSTVAAAQTSPRLAFRDIAPSSGVEFSLNNAASPKKYQIETMISGVAVLDYDGDGLLDIYFVNGAQTPQLEKTSRAFHNRLYRNEGKGRFVDRTAEAGVAGKGYGMGIAVGDYDNDGDPDLYLAGVNHNQLYRNNDDGTFSDVAETAGVSGVHPRFGKTWSVSAAWFDYDNDGALDLFVTNYVRWSPDNERECLVQGLRTYCAPDQYEGLPNILYRNNGDGTFRDVSGSSGIGAHIGKGMGVAIADLDDDGFVDVFVANDTFRNFLFHNDGGRRFTETGILAGVAYTEDGRSIAGMGAAFRDVDNDGDPDVFVTGMVNDTYPLYRNEGGYFEDITNRAGVGRTTGRLTGWGNGIFDFDNDGRKDLFAANGSILDNAEQVERLPAKLPNLVLVNEGATFRDLHTFKDARMHRGAAFGDLNNDGRVDVVTVSLNDRPEILMNDSEPSNHWLILSLSGVRSNKQGIGARIKVIPESGPTLFNHATTSVGLSSSSDPRVHFGLGRSRSVKSVEIRWPSGAKQVLDDVAADQIVTVVEP